MNKRAVFAGFAGTLALGGFRAAAASAQAGQGIDDQLQEIVVTGSRIRRTESESPSPVQVISRDDIEKSGQQSIADVIRQVSADNQGSLPAAFSGGFATGASGVSLRGLGLGSTLVLVNGKRMAAYPLADDGARVFVDLNTLPFEAVDHVDVLKDGASAIYGSDAVAGVVNVVLLQKYEGASLAGDLGQSTYGDGSELRFSGKLGTGNLESDHYNWFATAEFAKDDAIAQANRPSYLGTNNLAPFGWYDNRRGGYAAGRYGNQAPDQPGFSATTPYGTVRVPGGTPFQRINLTACPEVSNFGVCLYDNIAFIQVQPRTERENIYSRGSYRFSDSATGWLELGWFHDQVDSLGPAGALADGGVFNPADPLNPVAHQAVLPANHPDNPTGVARNLSLLTPFLLGGRNSHVKTDVFRLFAGLDGKLSPGWDYQLSVGYSDASLHRTQTGFVSWSALNAALANGTFRIDPALDSPATLAAISPALRDNPTDSRLTADASVSGTLLELPGGKLGVAAGLEFRKEVTEAPAVPGTDTTDIIGLGYAAFNQDRSIYAAYAEANLPIAAWLDVDGAMRYDHYSDYGSSTTPKVGIKLTPIPQLALRGTWSQSFRAPGPTESGKSASFGFTNIAIVTVGDPHVKPETADTFTIGVVFEPATHTSVSLDYYNVRRHNEITPADQASIVGGLPTSCTNDPNLACADTRVPGAQAHSFVFYDSTGLLAGVIGPYLNLNRTSTSGLDIDLRQSFSLAGGSQLEARVLWTSVFSLKRQQASGATFEYVGTQGPFALSSAGGTPRNRGSFEITWKGGSAELTGRLNYVAGMRLIDHQGESLVQVSDNGYITTTDEQIVSYYVANPNGVVCAVYNPDGTPFHGDCTSSSFLTLDAVGKWKVGGHAELDLSVTNLFNRLAPFNPYTYGGTNYNPAYTQAGAVGRYIVVGGRYNF